LLLVETTLNCDVWTHIEQLGHSIFFRQQRQLIGAMGGEKKSATITLALPTLNLLRPRSIKSKLLGHCLLVVLEKLADVGLELINH